MVLGCRKPHCGIDVRSSHGREVSAITATVPVKEPGPGIVKINYRRKG